MFGIGDEFFVHFAQESRIRVLHPAKIVGTEDGSFTAEFEESDLNAEGDHDIVLFYNMRSKFMQQPGQIISVVETEPRLVVSIQTTGELASAESREYYRVSTVLSELTIDVEEVGACGLLDVSATGLAISSKSIHGIGQLLNLTFDVEDHAYKGRACVQSIQQLRDGKTRYGLLCIAEQNTKGTLREGLCKLSMTVQRRQLQRLSGIA